MGKLILSRRRGYIFIVIERGGVVIMIGFKNKSMEEVWRMVIVDRYKL